MQTRTIPVRVVLVLVGHAALAGHDELRRLGDRPVEPFRQFGAGRAEMHSRLRCHLPSGGDCLLRAKGGDASGHHGA
ncbi:hypothetical protein D3C72_1018640 [compost metagenome]